MVKCCISKSGLARVKLDVSQLFLMIQLETSVLSDFLPVVEFRELSDGDFSQLSLKCYSHSWNLSDFPLSNFFISDAMYVYISNDEIQT